MKMDIKRFTIGDWVIVAAVTEFNTIAGERKSTRKQFDWPKLGQITGIGKRYEGMLCEGGVDSFSGEYDPLEFQQSVQVMGWLVRFGLSNKEQFVLPEDLEPSFAPTGVLPNVDGRKRLSYQSGQYKWKQRDKDMMRDEMAKVPRDRRGRWIKFVPQPATSSQSNT